ncbi:DUF1737 domain-containing protein [Flexithrix dorotheae]|uniref:DUF1737 domain-containing protein n=1 Tax=Flexithrix dorotheae TaxID=70993 RepID=UPI00036A5914|nr:DUF1737 domain-containing protein [Flexithrix dorotheae]
MSRKVIDYKIISSSNPRFVEKEVKKLLSEGWELLGGASIGEINRGGTMDGFCQSMVKYEA